MSFKSGTVIEVLEKNDDWWHGRCQGTLITGWFPSNRAVPPKTTTTTASTGPIKTTKKAPAPPGSGGGAVKASRPAPVPTSVPTTPVAPTPPQGEAMKAVYDFEGQQASDLRYPQK